jgi:hypothetical protein
VADEPQVKVFPRGIDDEFPHGPPTAVITDRGCRLLLRFAPGDFTGEGPVEELRVLPGAQPLEPRVLRRFAPQADVYVAYARAAMRVLKPDATSEENWERLRGAADALRAIGGPGRGHSDAFYRQIATQYDALVSEGEPHPIKTIGEINHATISASSRWVKEARRRGHITGTGGRAA